MRDRFSFPVVNEKNCFHTNMYLCPSCYSTRLISLSSLCVYLVQKHIETVLGLAKAGEIHCGLEKTAKKSLAPSFLLSAYYFAVPQMLRFLAFGIAMHLLLLHTLIGLLFLHFLCLNFLLYLS